MNDPVVPGSGGETRSRSLAACLLLAAIRSYQVTFSSLLGGQCRFLPSCSDYAAEAIARHGAIRGSWLAAWRVVRCQPLCRGGLDLVPAPRGPRGEAP